MWSGSLHDLVTGSACEFTVSSERCEITLSLSPEARIKNVIAPEITVTGFLQHWGISASYLGPVTGCYDIKIGRGARVTEHIATKIQVICANKGPR